MSKLLVETVQPHIRVGAHTFGSKPLLIAGPCSVESRSQLLEIAYAVKAAGAHLLRGGAFKPRTSPYSFRGLGQEGLELLAEARAQTGLPIVTEVLAVQDIELVAQYADILQIGARNMQHFALLEAVGSIQKPIILKRGLAATVEEWLLAAEYILAQGNQQVILCERGIRTFETVTRFTLDLGAVAVVRQRTMLPVIVDPSHAAGKRELVAPLAFAAIAAGAQGLLIEVHTHPEEALSDKEQAISPDECAQIVRQVERMVVSKEPTHA